jgi:protein gp37
MADKSGIEWTDATVNFWWGCTKVGPGCDHCYAEAWDKRTGGSHWGLNAPRRKIASAVKLIHRLDNEYADWAADRECIVGNAKAFGLPVPNMGLRRRVFIQSMSDLFDLEVPLEWFAEAWGRIEVCNRIDIQIVTKRISVVEKRLAAAGVTQWPRHAGLMVTVVNQEEADRDVPRLLALKAKFDIPWVGLSIEPMLGPVNLRRICVLPQKPGSIRAGIHIDALSGRYCESGVTYTGEWDIRGPAPGADAPAVRLDWIIAGGESGKDARTMHPDWARSLRDQCAAAGVPFFFKQWGEYLPVGQSLPGCGKVHGATAVKPGRMKLHYGGTPQQAPEHAFAERGVEFASTADGRLTFRVGKKAAGRLLDGVEHNAMPEVTR